ncbi:MULTISPECIES: hypothetical protein [unclassified Anabaena]|uniref:hypothetical protein n=1 Tax=unclassified Anabaena TaxID=2619674 RepID=UPI0008322A80|nr:MULTISPECIES: hypothetical protein [unclassified Anabaena]
MKPINFKSFSFISSTLVVLLGGIVGLNILTLAAERLITKSSTLIDGTVTIRTDLRNKLKSDYFIGGPYDLNCLSNYEQASLRIVCDVSKYVQDGSEYPGFP